MHQQRWEAVGRQLVSEEQQAAEKAVSKKAKKLRQKLNKQAQHAASDSTFADLPGQSVPTVNCSPGQSVNDVKCSSETVSVAFALEHEQQDSSLLLQAASEGLPPSVALEAGSIASGTPGSTAGSNWQESGLPVSVAQQAQEAADAEMQPSKQASVHSEEPDNSMDNVSFLQELFRCPITQVSPLRQ